MNNAQLASKILSILQLENQPIALSFVENVPNGIQTFDQEVPSACTFWRKADSGVFFAPAQKHYNCPVGALTMGFDLPENVQKELMGFVHKMVSSDYLVMEEAEKIPTSKTKKAGIVYGQSQRISDGG